MIAFTDEGGGGGAVQGQRNPDKGFMDDAQLEIMLATMSPEQIGRLLAVCSAHNVFLDVQNMDTGGHYLMEMDGYEGAVSVRMAGSVWTMLTAAERRAIQWQMVFLIMARPAGACPKSLVQKGGAVA